MVEGIDEQEDKVVRTSVPLLWFLFQLASYSQPVVREARDRPCDTDYWRPPTFPNGSGNFQVFEVQQSVATQTEGGRTAQEKTYRSVGLGQMSLIIERTASSEWSNREKQSGKMSRTYSTFVPGRASDGHWHFVEQRNMSTTTAPDGNARTERQVQQVNPGAPEHGLRTTAVVIECFTTPRQASSRDSNGRARFGRGR